MDGSTCSTINSIQASIEIFIVCFLTKHKKTANQLINLLGSFNAVDFL